MNKKVSAIILVGMLVVGCIGQPESLDESCEGLESTEYTWDDYYQWSSLPMSYGNSTIWQLNNSSTNNLWVNVSVVAYFSESILLLDRGYFNLSLYENDTLLWTNQTTDNIMWSFNTNVTLNDPIYLEIQSQGKDTHPESTYGDYFVMNTVAHTYSPMIC